MTPSNGNPKCNFNALFGWLDEETVKQPKKRLRSTSSIKKSSKADGSKKTTQAKINDIIIATTTATSSNTAIPSSSTDESLRLKTVTPTKLERQHNILLEFEKAFPENTLHVHHQQQQQLQQHVANTNSRSSHDDELEEYLASACNSHFLQLAPDDVNKKKLKKAAHNGGTKNNKTAEHPEKQKKSPDQAPEAQKNSSDRALGIASKKLVEMKKGVEYWIRNTPLNGYTSRSFDLLPAEPLKHVASYLTAPSQAIFDVALNGDRLPTGGPDDENSRGVAGDQFDVLDFGQIEKSLASKLRDRHLKAILLRIDAVNNLKRLRLTNCVKIEGDGLVPLRGSRIIEQIDLSIVGWKGWKVWQNYSTPQILSNKVQPILVSIIEREGCALKHLQFSKEPTVQFLRRYTEMLRRRNRRCQFEFSQSETGLVRERYTCYGCLNHFCGSCRGEELGPTAPWPTRLQLKLRSCKGCTRFFCQDCRIKNGTSCSVCSYVFCKDCENSFSDCYSSQCDRKVCSDCTSANKCKTCKRIWCTCCTRRRLFKLSTCEECNGQDGSIINTRRAMSRRSRPERHVVYGDAFTTAPICDM